MVRVSATSPPWTCCGTHDVAIVAWTTETTIPAIDSAPPRGANGPGIAAMLTTTMPLPVPLVGLTVRTGSMAVTLHSALSQPAGEIVTLIVPLPPPAGMVTSVGDTVKVQ